MQYYKNVSRDHAAPTHGAMSATWRDDFPIEGEIHNPLVTTQTTSRYKVNPMEVRSVPRMEDEVGIGDTSHNCVTPTIGGGQSDIDQLFHG